MQEIVGKKIVKVTLNSDSSWIYFTDENDVVYAYEADGDCCASAYIENVNSPEYAIGFVTNVEEDSCNLYNNDNCDVLDATFYRISTQGKGTCTIELRISHNGYYGGCLEFREVSSPNGEVIAEKKLWKCIV